jgi:hypothetical protein
VLLVAIILPLSVGVVVKAFAWQIVLRRDGVVSQFLVGTGIWSEPQRLLFTETGLVIGAANVFLPFMILPIYSVVKLIDPRLSEAGGDARREPALPVPPRHPAADAARHRVRHRLRLLDVGLDVRHPEPADRRPLPDAGDADRPVLPAHAQRGAGIDHGGGAAGARGVHRRRLVLARAAARRARMTAIERVASALVWAVGLAVVFLLRRWW